MQIFSKNHIILAKHFTHLLEVIFAFLKNITDVTAYKNNQLLLPSGNKLQYLQT